MNQTLVKPNRKIKSTRPRIIKSLLERTRPQLS